MKNKLDNILTEIELNMDKPLSVYTLFDVAALAAGTAQGYAYAHHVDIGSLVPCGVVALTSLYGGLHYLEEVRKVSTRDLSPLEKFFTAGPEVTIRAFVSLVEMFASYYIGQSIGNVY